MKALEVINDRAAGLDVGSEKIHASIGGDSPRVFGTFTKELFALRDWLLAEKAESVAMEATGIYWLAVYEVLEAAGLKLIVVIQHIQKALERMNLKIHDVISNIMGVSGLKIIQAILEGERDPERLVALADRSVLKHKRERLLAAMQGTWRAEHLFALRQAFELWESYQKKIEECDEQMAAVLKEMNSGRPPASPVEGRRPKRQSGHNAPKIPDLNASLRQLCEGVDPTQLPGFADYSVLMLISEIGTNLERWPTAKHFTAWLGLAPGSHQSGKRRGRVSRQRNRAGRIFCTVARTLARSVDKALGGFYRRIRSRRGGLVANQALARKLAELYWRTFTKNLQFVEQGLAAYHQQLLAQETRLAKKLASKLGYQLVPLPVIHG